MRPSCTTRHPQASEASRLFEGSGCKRIFWVIVSHPSLKTRDAAPEAAQCNRRTALRRGSEDLRTGDQYGNGEEDQAERDARGRHPRSHEHSNVGIDGVNEKPTEQVPRARPARCSTERTNCDSVRIKMR